MNMGKCKSLTCARIIAAWYKLKQDQPDFPAPGVGMPGNLTAPHTPVEGRNPADMPVILQGAVESHVLVKNEKDTLPLKAPKIVSIFGYSANTPPKWTAEGETDGTWRYGLAPVYKEDPGTSPIGGAGSMFGAGGSGAITPQTHVSPQDALVARAAQDGFKLIQDLTSAQPAVNPASDVCIVFGNAWAREGNDRPQLDDEYTDTMIHAVADQCAKTVVVFHNAGPRLVGGFVDHANVTAVVFGHLPGEQSGAAIVSLLWGDVNPSGKLPYTLAKTAADYGPLLDPTASPGSKSPQAYFPQGIYTDYKYFEKAHIEPRYEFGFGLSYTRFDYSEIVLSEPAGAPAEYPSGEIVSGGQADLWEVIATVQCKLTNSGKVAGAEAAQMYVRFPGMQAKQLRGFSKPTLRPGETTGVSFELTRRDLSVWNTVMQKWQLQRGTYEIYIGRSSSKLPLKTTLTI